MRRRWLPKSTQPNSEQVAEQLRLLGCTEEQIARHLTPLNHGPKKVVKNDTLDRIAKSRASAWFFGSSIALSQTLEELTMRCTFLSC
jgi:hypothetical protein